MALGALLLAGASGLRAQAPPAGALPVEPSSTPLRGGAFEIGFVGGGASVQDKAMLDDCTWLGLRIGHRFAPFGPDDRLQLGVRSGWETCASDHEEIGSVDLIHIQLTLLLGVRVRPSVLAYWAAGFGELLGDSTVGRDNQVITRFSVHGGPGVTWEVHHRFVVDAALNAIFYEDFEFGTRPAGGTTRVIVPNLTFMLQF